MFKFPWNLKALFKSGSLRLVVFPFSQCKYNRLSLLNLIIDTTISRDVNTLIFNQQPEQLTGALIATNLMQLTIRQGITPTMEKPTSSTS